MNIEPGNLYKLIKARKEYDNDQTMVNIGPIDDEASSTWVPEGTSALVVDRYDTRSPLVGWKILFGNNAAGWVFNSELAEIDK